MAAAHLELGHNAAIIGDGQQCHKPGRSAGKEGSSKIQVSAVHGVVHHHHREIAHGKADTTRRGSVEIQGKFVQAHELHAFPALFGAHGPGQVTDARQEHRHPQDNTQHKPVPQGIHSIDNPPIVAGIQRPGILRQPDAHRNLRALVIIHPEQPLIMFHDLRMQGLLRMGGFRILLPDCGAIRNGNIFRIHRFHNRILRPDSEFKTRQFLQGHGRIYIGFQFLPLLVQQGVVTLALVQNTGIKIMNAVLLRVILREYAVVLFGIMHGKILAQAYGDIFQPLPGHILRRAGIELVTSQIDHRQDTARINEQSKRGDHRHEKFQSKASSHRVPPSIL